MLLNIALIFSIKKSVYLKKPNVPTNKVIDNTSNALASNFLSLYLSINLPNTYPSIDKVNFMFNDGYLVAPIIDSRLSKLNKIKLLTK